MASVRAAKEPGVAVGTQEKAAPIQWHEDLPRFRQGPVFP